GSRGRSGISSRRGTSLPVGDGRPTRRGRPPSAPQRLTARATMSYTARGRGRNAVDRAHVGIFIRRGRALRRQPYHARPWTQDELAFAIGTDPAHISRIE